ncbi:MAG TPA: response regulator [Armatimonadota bacterium]|nr:response regulator [Armatimonadota bacterium]
MPEQFELARFLETFVTEARERLSRIERGVMRLEHGPGDPDLFGELLREAHTLKGSARMIGLMRVDELAHRLEEVIGGVRDLGEQPPRPAIDVMLEAADALKALVEEAAGGPQAADTAELTKRMGRWGGQAAAAASGAAETLFSPTAAAPPGAGRAEARAQRAAGLEHTVRVDVAKLEKLSNLSLDLVSTCEQMKRAEEGLRRAAQEAQRMRRALTELAVRLEEAERSPARAAAVARDLANAASQQRALADELIGVRQAFETDAHRAHLVTEEMRELAIDLHMLPIATVFDAFPRAVRDLAAEYEKEVQFLIEGGEVKLDKKIIEDIGEPLLHLLRNAVVHGIEVPEARESAGKPRRGTIGISAATRANRILIAVRDDGAGMEVEALKRKALERGLIAEDQARELTDQQALDLAFQPGLSTTRMITDVSGRGIGMDVVRAVARRLNGTVAIASQPGAGCTITLELPLTLAMMHVILVRAGGCDLAMPSSFVRAVLNAGDDGRRSLPFEGEALAVVSLAGLMELGPNGNGRNGRPRRIVAIRAAGEQVGLAADDVLEEREVILRPLGPHLSRQRKVMAATLLAEGQVVPVLDVPGLVDAARSYQQRVAAAPVAAPKPRPSVLLVEDSVITADLERALLEQAGYEVVTAGDGVEALARLAERRFDLVVADVEMPHMDGFTLLERVRASTDYPQLPVVMVTSRRSVEDKRRGLALGANAYITKGTFDQMALLDTLGRLIG